jgi:succinate dehydrogenase/fumarate reductase cytochrome b subunit
LRSFRKRDKTKFEISPRKNGVKRWIFYHPQSIGRTAFILHRLSGIGLALYGLFHILFVSIYLNTDQVVLIPPQLSDTPLGLVVELLLLATIGFHSANGVRLILGSFGIAMDSPGRPDYPFKIGSFNNIQKILVMIAFIFGIMLFLLGFFLSNLS